jgi:hypothetical protein
MCYSARVWADYRKYQREFGATISIGEFAKLVGDREHGAKLKLPRALDLALAEESVDGIGDSIARWTRAQIAVLEQEIFKQRKRLADAERVLEAKPTKKASDDQRIASNKVAAALERLADLKRTEPLAKDSRIFPGMYAPVMVQEEGRRVLRPIRYQCRPEGKPALDDRKYPGTYNARRDNLEGFWKGLFGVRHALLVADVFYENVAGTDGKNRVLAFTRRPASRCLSPASGRLGAARARSCCPARRSPMIPSEKWRPRGTTAQSSTLGQNTSTLGLRVATCSICIVSSMTSGIPSTNIDLPHKQ